MSLQPNTHPWRSAAIAGLVLCAYALPLPISAAELGELRSTSVQLPEGDRTFPAGPGADVVDSNCLTCHSAGMVLSQPSLTKSAWTAEVAKMINTYKAPIAQEDVGPIVDYLVHLKRQP